MSRFEYHLEKNIFNLYKEIKYGYYNHGEYHDFVVCDNKKRIVSVAGIKDRIVHRIIYDYLYEIFDRTFIFDLWSCRRGKGLHSAIYRAKQLVSKYPGLYFWRSDIKKFFDNVDQNLLYDLVCLKVVDREILSLIREVIFSYNQSIKIGIPIGNLTSQIFANIYLNELDRCFIHQLKPKAYMRYGDDILVIDDQAKLATMQLDAREYITRNLKLTINNKSDFSGKNKLGIRFLGSFINQNSICILPRNYRKISGRLVANNVPSYWGMIKNIEPENLVNYYWQVLEKIV